MAGRPLKYKSVEEMQRMIDAYFAECDEKGEPYTITGLALALGTTRETLLDYENAESRRAFSDTVKKAKMRCQHYAEKRLFDAKNPVGIIFNLKNNYGWRDRQDVELTGKDGGPITFEIRKPEGL